MREDGVRGKSLYLPFESSVNLKVLFKKKKIKSIKKKKEQRKKLKLKEVIPMKKVPRRKILSLVCSLKTCKLCL